LRPLSYPQTQVFLVCFAINSPVSYKHVETKWKPEITHHSPGVPFIIVGTKSDIRSDSKVVESLQAKGKPLKSFDFYASEAKRLGAHCYMECSALRMVGLDELFQEAVRAATHSRLSAAKATLTMSTKSMSSKGAGTSAKSKAKDAASSGSTGSSGGGCILL